MENDKKVLFTFISFSFLWQYMRMIRQILGIETACKSFIIKVYLKSVCR